MSRSQHNRKSLKRALLESHASPSALVVASKLRGGAGTHADQRKRVDPKQIRRDKSYKDSE